MISKKPEENGKFMYQRKKSSIKLSNKIKLNISNELTSCYKRAHTKSINFTQKVNEIDIQVVLHGPGINKSSEKEKVLGR